MFLNSSYLNTVARQTLPNLPTSAWNKLKFGGGEGWVSIVFQTRKKLGKWMLVLCIPIELETEKLIL